MKKPEEYIEEALKLEKYKSIYEYINKDLTYERYEKISKLYESAGKIYKSSNRMLSIDCMIKAFNYLIVNNNSLNYFELKNMAIEIAHLYKPINHLKSLEYYNKALEFCTIQGDINGIIKIYEFIGEIFFDDNYLEEAKKSYFKIIELVELISYSFYEKKKLLINLVKYIV